MNKIAKFEKVSYEQFKKDYLNIFGTTKYDTRPTEAEKEIEEIYNSIELPRRATKGSAGYDFMIPMHMLIQKNHEYIIPTGIRCNIDDGWVLQMYPRSGLGFKRGLRLLNTVGIIDSDYYLSDNEGHIMIKMTHSIGDYILELNGGDKIVQGVFVGYGLTTDDNADKKRNGGFGSTDK